MQRAREGRRLLPRTRAGGRTVPRGHMPIVSSLATHLSVVPMRLLLYTSLAVAFGLFVLLHTHNLIVEETTLSSDDYNSIHLPPFVHADLSNCSEFFIDQRVDHFSYVANSTTNPSPATYKQRYFVNDDHWDPSDPSAPLFFYTGNEADVTLYVNHTGLMWENAPDFKALIVFAEHRYYGSSLPYGADYMNHLNYLTHEQALADFAELIYYLQATHKVKDHPVIVFGGSYGGMLSAWFRIKYPSIVHGAIAASAPIFGFPHAFPSFQGQQYWQVVTRDASEEAGAAPNCVSNAKRAWSVLFDMAKTEKGRRNITNIFKLCEPMIDEAQAEKLAMGILVAFDTMAMGNFPYESSYLTSGAAELPAWPVRAACNHLASDYDTMLNSSQVTSLLTGLRDAGNVFNNATGDVQCTKLPTTLDFDGIWDYQYCTEMLPQETYFDTNGETDMFWRRSVTLDDITTHCQQTWQVTPDPDWIRVLYGDENLYDVSNIVFSNGLLDPWSSGGVKHVPEGGKFSVVDIEEGAHHLDLFFSHPLDPESVRAARKMEIMSMRRWIREYVDSH